MLIITDVYSNIKRLLGIIEAIDVTGIGKQISTVPVDFATAEDLLKIIDSVFNAEKPGRKGGGKDVVLVSDERTNTIIVLASETDTERVKSLVQMLDKEVPRGKEKIHVYYLEHAKAEDLAQVLQEIPSKESVGEGQGKKLAPVISEDVKIKADKATNSLILVAEKDEYEIIKDIIQKLDIRRAMVYIECLIMEVNKDRSMNMGAEWIVGGEASYQDREGVYGGGFSGGAVGGGDAGYLGSLSAATGRTPMLPPGFSLGVFGEGITVGDITFPTIAAIINAYKKDKDVHILSTPQILTTDNEEAKITVGKNIPFLTKAATGDTNYSNYEYKDVGISLQITPQISKDRKIRLEIAQEVTKLETTTDLFQPTTLKRTIDTTVVIDDANTVVIGGLIDDSLSSTNYQIPCLGGIPVIGWLFRSIGRGHEETNLFVFLTPYVVQSEEEMKDLHQQKREEIDKVEEGQIKLFEFDGFSPKSSKKTPDK
jgi:general secretion pathway protein D